MKLLKKLSLVLALCFAAAVPVASAKSIEASATPSATKIVTAATNYKTATDVKYVYFTNKNYIANWGARGEDCVFLSTYAQNFYTGNYTFETLSTVKGGTTQSNAPSSTLYSSLQTLMKTPHTFFTYYSSSGSGDLRKLYLYTDCLKSDTTKVSLIYRGGTRTSDWEDNRASSSGNTWNQEHCWPKSKLSTSQQIGDIMHLRPSNDSENSSRGNKAYGTTTNSSYYNPGPSVRGDCARMMLYMYVRWGVTTTMWGSGGVMESLSVLLDWMEEDPVDTWEMGRNDAVQSITGTRNVFVDYPEYAWLLFGQEIPDDMTTPSGKAASTTPGQGGTTNPDQGGTTTPDQGETPNPDQGGTTNPDQGGTTTPDQGGTTNPDQDKPTTPETPDQEEQPDEENGDENCEHEFDSWFVQIDPTETEEGARSATCKKCGKYVVETIPALNDKTEGGTQMISCSSSVALPSLAVFLTAISCCFVLKKKD